MADFGFIWSGGIPHALSSSCYRWRFTWRRHIPCAISYVIQYIPEISIDGPPRAEWWSMEYILAGLRNISLTHSPLDKILLELVQNDSPYGKCSLRWRHNGHDSVSNHQPHDCLLNRIFRRRWSKKTSKLRVTGLCVGNSPGTGEFPAQMENVSIWWRHHVLFRFWVLLGSSAQVKLRISKEWTGIIWNMSEGLYACNTCKVITTILTIGRA